MLMRALDRLEEILIGTLIAAATTLIFVAVLHRYTLSGAISLAQWGKANGMDWLFQSGRAVFMQLQRTNRDRGFGEAPVRKAGIGIAFAPFLTRGGNTIRMEFRHD